MRFFLPFAAALVAVACSSEGSPAAPAAPPRSAAAPARPEAPAPAFVTIDTPSGAQRFSVELALTEPQRNKGLMFREHLDDDAGMLFVFDAEKQQQFWMKNTRIPLDMLFIDAAGTIVGIVESAEPLTLTGRKVDAPSRYVLELNGGASRARGIAAGQRVRFQGVPADLVDPRVLAGGAP